MNLIWTIGTVKTLDIGEKEKVIYSVNWTLRAEEGEKYAEKSGTQTLSTEDLSSFTEWSSVTSSQVETWIQNAMGTEVFNNLKLSLNKQLNETMTIVTERTLGT